MGGLYSSPLTVTELKGGAVDDQYSSLIPESRS